MAELPKIVRERLKAAPAGAHPDADLLTAFAEQALGERERAQVLAHLAACADCREVVALARPQGEEEEKRAAAAAPARGWMLRWQTAAALATVAVAAVALLTIPNSFFRSAPVSEMAKAPAPAKTAAEREEARNAPATQPAAPEAYSTNGKFADKTAAVAAQTARKKKEAEMQDASAADKVSAGLAKARTGAGAGEKDRFGGIAPTKDGQTRALAPLPPTPGAQAGAVSGAEANESKMATAAPQPAADQTKAQGAAGAGKAAGGYVATQKVPSTTEQVQVTAPPPVSTTVEVQATAPAVATSSAETTTAMRAGPLWRTTNQGKLELSRDAGHTWHAVHVAAGATLKVVSAVGRHVWTGGHQQNLAVLYYSQDAGAHWTRLDFTSPAPVPPADVVSLQFTDTQHGVMTVAPAASELQMQQIWVTSDGGRTWKLPPLR